MSNEYSLGSYQEKHETKYCNLILSKHVSVIDKRVTELETKRIDYVAKIHFACDTIM